MAIGVKIDFEKVYPLEGISDDLKISTFRSELQSGQQISLRIEISNESHEMLPNVYNLAFGPLNNRGQIDDKSELPHLDYSKVFSSILFTALNYLTHNPAQYLGIDGSDNMRAHYYWKFLQRNFEYLNQYFDIFGIKYYVRITRYGKLQYENPFDFQDIQPYPSRINKSNKRLEHMYNYFTFRLKSVRGLV